MATEYCNKCKRTVHAQEIESTNKHYIWECRDCNTKTTVEFLSQKELSQTLGKASTGDKDGR